MERRRFARDVAVQTVGTILGGLLLLVALKVGGLLGEVDWAQVFRSSGAVIVILAFGPLAKLAAEAIFGWWDERKPPPQ